MTVEAMLLQVIHGLPEGRRLEVLDFARFLADRVRPTSVRTTKAEGLWAGKGLDVTEADLRLSRDAIFRNFPRADL